MNGDRFHTPGGEPRRRGIPFSGRLLFGAVVLTLGVLWTLENLGLVDADAILQFWPALLLAFGLARLTGFMGPRQVVSGVLFTFVGAWMLARSIGLIDISIFKLWPVFLIVAGTGLVWKSMRAAPAPENAERDSYPRPFAIMGAVSRGVESQDLVGVEVSAVMGGVELDFRGAKARGREVLVEGFAWWGGIELIVPDDWLVVNEVNAIMGGVEDSTRVAVSDPATTLVLRGVVIMAGMEVRNKPSSDSSRKIRVRVRVGNDEVNVSEATGAEKASAPRREGAGD